MSAVKLPQGKKIWTKDYHVHALSDFNDSELVATIMDKDGQYFVGLIDKTSGSISSKFYSSDFVFDNKFQYRLWDGANIIKNGKHE